MKFLLDLFPILMFFAAYKWGGAHPDEAAALLSQYVGAVVQGGVIHAKEAPVLAATVVTIAATLLLVVIEKIRGKSIDTMQWVSLGIVTVFGGATLFFHDETFIKFKPTALYWLMGSALMIGQVFLNKNALKGMMGAQIKMSEAIWAKLLWAWVVFFAVMGALNVYVASHYSTDVWVNFKLFGTLGATIAFIVGQSLLISRHIEHDEKSPQ